MKTLAEMEAAICDGMLRFHHEFMGRGIKDIHTHIVGELVLIRLSGALTNGERHLVQTFPAEKGRDLLKQIRAQLIETAKPLLKTMIHEVTGVAVVSLHHDISTLTGEEVVIFTLAKVPEFQKTAKR